MSVPPAPEGFARRDEGGVVLYVRKGLEREIAASDLVAAERWEALLAGEQEEPGRGTIARATLGSGRRLILKRMRRGGLLGGLWRDRFLGTRRLFANLTIPEEVARRGVPTAAPIALLLREGPSSLFRGWLAVEEIEGARDLLTRLAETSLPTTKQLASVLAQVRHGHDRGIEHRDLNLGNLLVRETGGGTWEVFLVDLDRVVLRRAPLGFGRRQSALRRMHRSYEKRFGPVGPLGREGSLSWYALYAGDDEELRRRLETGIGRGRIWLAVHRLGWKRLGRAG